MAANSLRFPLVLTFAAALAAPARAAEPAAGRAADAEAIRGATRTYLQALEKGDGETLARLWTPDGDIVDELGRAMPGRETVAQMKPAAAAAPTSAAAPPAIRIAETNLRFLSADVAIEDGSVEVADQGGRGSLHGRYSATWVRQDGAWKLAALREARIEHVGGPAALADLEWMVGDWAVVDDPMPAPAGGRVPAEQRPSIEMRVKWNASRTFLLRDMRITPPGKNGPEAEMHISQRIGWDPLSRSIRSWVFSSDGSYGDAVWIRDDGSWVARNTTVHPDGRQTSWINIYTFDGKDRCTLRSLPTHVGGEHEPQVLLTMVRKSASPSTDGATSRRGQDSR